MLRRHAPLIFGILAVGVIVALSAGRPSQAEDEQGNSIVYVNVTGDGPTAKGWYRGAPPAGVPVQEALDHFAELGYRVAAVRQYQRPIITAVVNEGGIFNPPTEGEENFVILLQR